ncbi:MAG: hypothetical protein R3E32_06395 [Chitinophagales bacterium]
MSYSSTEKIEFRKIRSFSDHINATAMFTRQNIVPMIKILMQVAGVYIAVGLVLLIMCFYFGLVDLMNLTDINGIENLNWSMIGGLSFLAIVMFIIGSIFYTAAGYRYILEYITQDNYNSLTISDIKRYLGRDSKIVFFSYMGLFLMFFASMFIAIIPFLGALTVFFGWIYLSIPISFIFLLRIHEKIGFSDAIKRCMYLIKDHWWETFGLYLVTALLLYSISAVPSLFSNFGFQIGSMLDSEAIGKLLFGVFYVISILVSLLTSVVFSILIAFRYFSLVELKEGVNMMERIQDIGLGETTENDWR